MEARDKNPQGFALFGGIGLRVIRVCLNGVDVLLVGIWEQERTCPFHL